MLTRKALIDFNHWKRKKFSLKNNYFKENLTIYDSVLIMKWFTEVGSTEIGGHSISDMIYINLQHNKYIFESINLAIKTANKNYNEIH